MDKLIQFVICFEHKKNPYIVYNVHICHTHTVVIKKDRTQTRCIAAVVITIIHLLIHIFSSAQ